MSLYPLPDEGDLPQAAGKYARSFDRYQTEPFVAATGMENLQFLKPPESLSLRRIGTPYFISLDPSCDQF
jgi:hypothetical protein